MCCVDVHMSLCWDIGDMFVIFYFILFIHIFHGHSHTQQHYLDLHITL